MPPAETWNTFGILVEGEERPEVSAEPRLEGPLLEHDVFLYIVS